jgi:hypothetical protein
VKPASLTLAAAAVALMLVLAVLLNRAEVPDGGDLAERALLPDLASELAALRRLRLDDGDATLTIERADSDWRLVERDDYPVAFRRVDALFGELAQARLLEAKTARPEHHGRLGLLEPGAGEGAGLRLQLFTTDDATPRFALLLGEPATLRDGRYVRKVGEDQSWLVDRRLEVGLDVADWLDTELLDLEYDRVRSFRRSGSDGEFEASRPADGDAADFVVESLPEAQELRYASVLNSAVRALLNLRFEDVARRGADWPPAEPTVTRYRTADGLRLTATVWREDGQPWLAVDAALDTGDADAALRSEVETLDARLSPWRYRISEYSYGELSKGLDAYLTQEQQDDADQLDD